MKGTNDELKFGDEVELDFTRDDEKTGKTVHHHLEVKFIPSLIDLLVEKDIIDVKDIQEEGTLNFVEDDLTEDSEYTPDDVIENIIESIEDIEKRLDNLEETVKTISTNQHEYIKVLNRSIDALNNMVNTFKPASKSTKK